MASPDGSERSASSGGWPSPLITAALTIRPSHPGSLWHRSRLLLSSAEGLSTPLFYIGSHGISVRGASLGSGSCGTDARGRVSVHAHSRAGRNRAARVAREALVPDGADRRVGNGNHGWADGA